MMFSINMHGLNLKIKKNGKTVLNVLSKIVNESNREPNRLWADKRREF